MRKGKKVYDPLTDTWSTGWWIALYSNTGHIKEWIPVWSDKKHMDD